MPLKKSEIEKFKEELIKLRSQLTHSLRGSTKDVQTPDESGAYSQHQADKGTDDFNRSVSLELTSQEYGMLRNINRALEKIDENTYGICDITGEEIAKARLEAMPYATVTVKAQEQLEKGLL